MDCLLQLKRTWKLLTSLIFILRYRHGHLVGQNIYQAYKKPSDKPLNINKNSNSNGYKTDSQGYIKTDIWHVISSKEIYDQSINYYKDALKHSRYDNISLPYNPTQQQGQDKIEKEKRKRKNGLTHLF